MCWAEQLKKQLSVSASTKTGLKIKDFVHDLSLAQLHWRQEKLVSGKALSQSI